MIDTTPFKPNWLVHPGETVADVLEELGMSQVDAANRLGSSKKFVNGLIRGKANISADTAHSLSLVLGSTTEFWMRLQAHYDAEKARFAAEEELVANHSDWLKRFPMPDLMKFGWIPDASTKGAKITALLRFFGVKTPVIWEENFAKKAIAFRTSKTHIADIGATAAWLRQAERLAQATALAPLDRPAFKDLLPTLKGLSRHKNFATAWAELTASCASVGVAVVLVPPPKGCRASGATFFLGTNSAVLALSGRHKSDDHLWFSFYHEAGHIVLHSKKLTFIETNDRSDSKVEREADAFARDMLIPPAKAKKLKLLSAAKDIQAFAKELDIAPGIVVGRMQHDGLIPQSHHNGLKQALTWNTKDASGKAAIDVVGTL